MVQSKRTHSIPSESRINVTSYTLNNKGENVKKWGFHSNAQPFWFAREFYFLTIVFFFLSVSTY